MLQHNIISIFRYNIILQTVIKNPQIYQKLLNK